MTYTVEGTPPPPSMTPGHVVVPGLEARHTFNDLTMGDLGVWPRFKIRDVPGLRASPDGDANADPAQGRIGEIPRKSVRRGKTLVYQVTLQARNLHELRAGQSLRERTFAEFDREGVVVIAQHPYLEDRVPPITFRARAVHVEPATEQPKDRRRPDTAGYEQDFDLTLRMSDPRFYIAQATVIATGAIGEATGATLPFTLPVTIPRPQIEAGVAHVDNIGSTDSDPTIDVHGPIPSSWTIANVTAGGQLSFANLPIPLGDFVRIDFRNRTVRLNAAANARRRLLRATSNWWDADVPGIAPGPNLIRLFAPGMADPARAEVSFLPATL